MCGIAGWINWGNNLIEHDKFIEKMMKKLYNRGPDEQGKYISNNALLGHRRLIVVDPDGGKQPMLHRQKGITYVLVYNGELYNTEEVRKNLVKEGFDFNSYSDTEVILKSYVMWKEDCVKHLNGIYAFAIWEEENKTLFMARDRMGVKPLFYNVNKEGIIFASEIKALLEHPLVQPIIDEKGLLELFGLGPARSLGSGIIKGIEEVKPGEFIKVSKEKIIKKTYWYIEAKEHHENLETTTEHVRYLVLDAIKKQLVSDVPVCTFLSGGLDSSIISAVSSRIMKEKGYPLKTFSLDYQDNYKYFKASDFQQDMDNKWIQLMVNNIGSKHKNVIITIEELIDALDNAVEASDLPGMADIDSSLLLFCKEVKRNATVALSGECADEIFGGYPWFNKEEDLNCTTFPWSKYVKERQSILSKEFQTIPLEEYVREKFNKTIKEGQYVDDFETSRLQKMTYLNLKWFMVTLLNRKERMSMANSLEVRVPFADHRIVEYTYNIPRKMKYLNGQEKGILRAAMKGLLPDEILSRKKNPYPKTHNPKYLELIQWKMKDILNQKDAPIKQIIDQKALKDIVETGGEAFNVPWYGQLMTGPQLLAYFYQINSWLKKYKIRIEI